MLKLKKIEIIFFGKPSKYIDKDKSYKRRGGHAT
jgi:hypothetical protein